MEVTRVPCFQKFDQEKKETIELVPREDIDLMKMAVTFKSQET